MGAALFGIIQIGSTETLELMLWGFLLGGLFLLVIIIGVKLLRSPGSKRR